MYGRFVSFRGSEVRLDRQVGDCMGRQQEVFKNDLQHIFFYYCFASISERQTYFKRQPMLHGLSFLFIMTFKAKYMNTYWVCVAVNISSLLTRLICGYTVHTGSSGEFRVHFKILQMIQTPR